MAVELLSARMLAPYFGSGLYTWGTVIGITVLALALGYYAGGKLAEKNPGQECLYWLILLASSFIIVMPAEAKTLTMAFSDVNPLSALIAIAMILLIPCLMLYSMTPVVLIHLLTENTGNSGKTAGNVFAVSTIGGIISTFLTGFYIIPGFGLSVPALVLGLVPGTLCFLMLLLRGKIIVIAYFIVVMFGFLELRGKNTHSNIKIHHISEGIMGQLLVADVTQNNNTNRFLFVDRMGQTYMNLNTGAAGWGYVDYITAVSSYFPQGSEALLLGLGGGMVANNLYRILGQKVTAVEFDARIPGLARKYFSLNDAVTVVVDDARHYLKSADKKQDLIIMDLYKGETVPFHLYTLESLRLIQSNLKSEGLLIVNFNGFLNGEEGKAGRSLYKTLAKAGFHIRILPTYGIDKYRNCIFIASMQEKDFSELRMPLKKDGNPVNMETLFTDPNQLDLDDGVVFNDDKPLLELYNINAAKVWREEYNQYYTKMFTSKGVELFK